MTFRPAEMVYSGDESQVLAAGQCRVEGHVLSGHTDQRPDQRRVTGDWSGRSSMSRCRPKHAGRRAQRRM